MWLYKNMNLLVKDRAVLVDDDDYVKVANIRWHISSTGYVVWRGKKDGKKLTIRMHRLITQCPKGKVVDHINHNPLDNRKDNLRICTQGENARNRKSLSKGYWYHKQNKNWVVELESKHVGCFPIEDEAIKMVAFIRAGGVYKKPLRACCSHGHSLIDAYHYNERTHCRRCQSIRSKEYYVRKTKRHVVENNDRENW